MCDDQDGKPVDWWGVAIFFVIACGWSALAAHWAALALPARVGGSRIDDAVLVGFGPAFGAAVAGLLRPRRRKTTMLGPHPGWMLLAIGAPTVSLLLWSLAMPSAGHAKVWPFAISVTIYCIGEELGWRGWLHDALAGQQRWKAASITAALWYGWHWTFLADQLRDPRFGLSFALGIFVASIGLAAAVRRVEATGIAVAWHAAVKLLIAPAQLVGMIAVIALANWAAGRVRKS